jgi:5-methylthioadenosine/S-adenosylhomocysteine deaminase
MTCGDLPPRTRGKSPARAALSALTVTGAILDGKTIGVRCEDGAIAAIGADVVPEPGDETIDAAGAPLVPALVNGHTHAAMTLFRGYGGDLPLMRWLREKVWPVEERLEAEDVYWGTRLACLEMIRTGTARFWDMYWQPAATARAVVDAGLRATIGGPLFDLDGRTAEMRAGTLRGLEELEEFDPRIERALAPHSIYAVSEELLRWTAEQATERDLPVHIHFAETEGEVSDCVEEHGVRPPAHLDRLGLLGERTLLAHGVWLDREELELIAARGCTVVTNPVANMKLAVGGVFPYPTAREAGVAVGLGTDGAGSNDSLDLLSDLKAFALIQRHAAVDPTVLPATEGWEIAIGQRAPLLWGDASPGSDGNLPSGAGSLQVGSPADFLLLRHDAHEIALGDLAADLVYAAAGSVVDTTVVAGRVLMHDGIVDGAEEVVARAAERASRLGIG